MMVLVFVAPKQLTNQPASHCISEEFKIRLKTFQMFRFFLNSQFRMKLRVSAVVWIQFLFLFFSFFENFFSTAFEEKPRSDAELQHSGC
jgi:hypothetical protein